MSGNAIKFKDDGDLKALTSETQSSLIKLEMRFLHSLFSFFRLLSGAGFEFLT
jgi:hypothetical protein